MTFRILTICTGNICRSPVAEALVRDGLARRLGPAAAGFEVASAGTWGLEGEPMQEDSLAALAAYGVDGSAFRARRIDATHVTDVDLVLAATREHRAAAATLVPRVVRRAFTVRELARLCTAVDPAALPTGDPEERARAVVAAAASQRGLVRAEQPADDDVADPYRGPQQGYADAAAQIHAALQLPLDLIGGPVPA